MRYRQRVGSDDALGLGLASDELLRSEHREEPACATGVLTIGAQEFPDVRRPKARELEVMGEQRGRIECFEIVGRGQAGTANGFAALEPQF